MGAARYLLLREQLLVPPPLLLQQLPVPAGKREPQSASQGARGGITGGGKGGEPPKAAEGLGRAKEVVRRGKQEDHGEWIGNVKGG